MRHVYSNVLTLTLINLCCEGMRCILTHSSPFQTAFITSLFQQLGTAFVKGTPSVTLYYRYEYKLKPELNPNTFGFEQIKCSKWIEIQIQIGGTYSFFFISIIIILLK